VTHLNVDRTRLAYRVDGADAEPALALLHSLGTDLRLWDAQAAALARDFRVVRPDFRGHGGSDVSREPVTVDRLGRDVLALLDYLSVERAHLCGLSLGGVVALWVAAHHPDRVGRLVLANTGARIGTAESWEARIRAVREGGMAALRDVVLARWLSADFRARHPEVVRLYADMLEATPAEGYVAACLALRDADLRGVAGTVRTPTLVIAGELDEATPPALSEALHAAIPGSELVVLPGAAHLSNVERPDEFTRALSRFLAP
jgi:3-oxoadipate enol-lactonase